MTGAQTSAEAVAKRLREAILSGDLHPGQKIHQDHIADLFGVSRTPLRTALSMLAQSGLVVYESNKGFRVREYSLDQIQHAFIVRAELEALACRLAAANMNGERARALHELVIEGDRLLKGDALDPDNRAAYRAMNVEFHSCIMDYAGNTWIREMVDWLYNVPLISDRVIIWKDKDIFVRTHDDHRRIAHALECRDGSRASAIMREHVTFAIEYMLGLLRESGEASPNQLQALGLYSPESNVTSTTGDLP